MCHCENNEKQEKEKEEKKKENQTDGAGAGEKSADASRLESLTRLSKWVRGETGVGGCPEKLKN